MESALEYKSRTVGAWLGMAERGELALPSFQRSYVWKSRQFIEDYVEAVFRNRPTGVFLILKTNGSPQLESRSLRGIDIDVASADELLLDGQQRLTSLWQVLNGRTGNVTYYAEGERFVSARHAGRRDRVGVGQIGGREVVEGCEESVRPRI